MDLTDQHLSLMKTGKKFIHDFFNVCSYIKNKGQSEGNIWKRYIRILYEKGIWGYYEKEENLTTRLRKKREVMNMGKNETCLNHFWCSQGSVEEDKAENYVCLLHQESDRAGLRNNFCKVGSPWFISALAPPSAVRKVQKILVINKLICKSLSLLVLANVRYILSCWDTFCKRWICFKRVIFKV